VLQRDFEAWYIKISDFHNKKNKEILRKRIGERVSKFATMEEALSRTDPEGGGRGIRRGAAPQKKIKKKAEKRRSQKLHVFVYNPKKKQ
jgi:hypothetical protein